MTAYYKATRIDGTDFRTGKIRYEVGATVEHPNSKRFGNMRPNYPSTYLSVSVESGEVLTGGFWPCRLFRVEPVGRTVKRTDGRYPWKRGCTALTVIEDLPAHLVLGPNGDAVVALIERAKFLTYDEALRLKSARHVAWHAWRESAWETARHVAWHAWRESAWKAARNAARDAARDAAGALLIRDLITSEQFDVLYGPWASVMEISQ